MKPNVGEDAPEFRLPVAGASYAEGDTVSLAELRGETVVLVFYPKDGTPGCTAQACALRDGWAEVRGKARLFGVSADSVKRHRTFIEQQQLPYPLLSDPDHRMIEAYGVWVQKSMMGKTFMGIERTTFVIGPDGKIAAVLEKVSPARHLDLLLKALA